MSRPAGSTGCATARANAATTRQGQSPPRGRATAETCRTDWFAMARAAPFRVRRARAHRTSARTTSAPKPASATPTASRASPASVVSAGPPRRTDEPVPRTRSAHPPTARTGSAATPPVTGCARPAISRKTSDSVSPSGRVSPSQSARRATSPPAGSAVPATGGASAACTRLKPRAFLRHARGAPRPPLEPAMATARAVPLGKSTAPPSCAGATTVCRPARRARTAWRRTCAPTAPADLGRWAWLAPRRLSVRAATAWMGCAATRSAPGPARAARCRARSAAAPTWAQTRRTHMAFARTWARRPARRTPCVTATADASPTRRAPSARPRPAWAELIPGRRHAMTAISACRPRASPAIPTPATGASASTAARRTASA